MRKTARAAFRASVPILPAYLFVGVAFGLLCVHAGLSPVWPILMSSVVYAGSMQFIAIDFLVAGTGLLQLFLVTLAANLRHVFYGLSMLEIYRDAGRAKPYLIFSLTDETYSLLCTGQTPSNTDPKRYRLLVSLFNQGYWIAGTMIGALAGERIGFQTTGIDFSMTALFLVICVEQWRSTPRHFPALLGGGCSLAALLLLGSDRFMIPSLLAMAGTMLLLRPRSESMDRKEERI